MSEKDKHKTFLWEYFDRGIIKSSKGVTDEVKCKNCCCGKVYRLFDKWLLRHLKSKHSIENELSLVFSL